MPWVTSKTGAYTVRLVDGYVPDTDALLEAAGRFSRYSRVLYCPDDLRPQVDDDTTAAWLLSTLGRRHLRYYEKIDPRAVNLHTWILDRPAQPSAALQEWFDYQPHRRGFRVIVHGYPTMQCGHNLDRNIFKYPHSQAGIHHPLPRHKALREATRELANELVKAYEDNIIEGVFARLGHPYVGSEGWPTQ